MDELLKLFLKFLFIVFRDRERRVDLLFQLLMRLLVDSCVRPDQRSSLQPWHIGIVL